MNHPGLLLTGALVWLVAAAAPAHADEPKISEAMGMLHGVCLEAWPDFEGFGDAARRHGLEDWSEDGQSIWGNADTGTGVTVVAPQKLLVVEVFPAQCIVSVLGVAFDTVVAGVDSHGITLADRSLLLTRQSGGSGEARRTFADDAGNAVHVLLLDLPEDNAVAIAVAPESYE